MRVAGIQSDEGQGSTSDWGWVKASTDVAPTRDRIRLMMRMERGWMVGSQTV